MNANGKMLILFVILLLGLVLCSFLGGKGCVEGFEEYVGKHVSAKQNSDGSIVFTGSNGKIVTLTKNPDGSYTGPNGYTATIDSNGKLVVKRPDNNTVTTTVTITGTTTSGSGNNTTTYDDYNHYSGASSTTYYGPNGGTAKVIDNGGQGKVVIVNTNGYTTIYYIKKDNSNVNSRTATSSNGGTATIVTDNNGQAAIKITLPDGTSTLYTINYNGNPSVDNTINQYDSTSTRSGSNYNNAYAYTGPNGNTAVTGPNGNTAVTGNSSTYYSSLPPGIPANQIPAGQEDLYILKSQVVPPVCPKCPDPIVRSSENQDNTKCPPCPPCARCPEPAFDCKKVPNYNAFNQSYLPVPVLTDFSGFGM